MASSTEDPILIPSDDEGSDCDDVVLVKEEIEVDTDDVIFLSETKPAPQPDSENSTADASSRQTGDSVDRNENKPLNLSSDASLIPLTSAVVNTTTCTDDFTRMCDVPFSPLDLSAKSNSKVHFSSSDGSTKCDMQDSFFKLFPFDTDLYNNLHLTSSSQRNNSPDAAVIDNKTQGPQSSSGVQCDKVSGTGSGRDNRSTSDKSIMQTSSLSNTADQLSDINSKTFHIDSTLDIRTSSVSSSFGSATITMTMDSSRNSQKLVASKPQPSSSVVTKADTSGDNVTSSRNTDSSQKLLTSSNPLWSSQDDGIVNKIKLSLPCYLMDTTLQSPSSLSGSNAKSRTDPCVTNVSSSWQHTLQQTSTECQMVMPGSQNALQTPGNFQQASRPQLMKSENSQSAFQTNPVLDSQMADNSSGSSLNQGLPGGSQNFTTQTLIPSNSSAFQCLDSLMDNHNSAKYQMKRSVSCTDQTFMYNPLTLPKSQKETYMRSFSSSSMISWSSDDDKKRKSDSLVSGSTAASSSTLDAGASTDDAPFQLPPKKQKRCFMDRKCTVCMDDVGGENSCKCPNGHTTCAKCLEEKVKKILTGKAKESIRCLNLACDSFYPMSELKLCLPSMVVEILEDRLDQDYIDYFSSMLLKTALDETNGEVFSEMEVENSQMSISGTIPKKPAETDPELPQHWEPMNEKAGYQMFELNVNSDEYNHVLPMFFSSMINHKVEVVRIHRIQNPILWKYYSVKKKEMLLDNDGFGCVNERQLYHGTTSSVVDAICRKGFDWRVCGKNGTLFGEGTYFAANASYSHQYTDTKTNRHTRYSSLLPNINQSMPPGFNSSVSSQLQPVYFSQMTFVPNPLLNLSSSSNLAPHVWRQRTSSVPSQYTVSPKPASIRSVTGMPTWPLKEMMEQKKQTTQMFVARVLVGKYSGGESKLRKPPPLDPKSDPFGKCYDSCVDDIHMPKIYVIFDSTQAYPEYLIEYTYE